MQKIASPAEALSKGVAIGLRYPITKAEVAVSPGQHRGFRFWRSKTITKTLLVMKLTILLLTVTVLSARATGVAQKVTLSGKNLSLKEVFTVIEKQTGYVITANEGVFLGTKPISLEVFSMSLEPFLDTILKDQVIKYVIQGKTIFLSRMKPVTNSIKPMDIMIAPPIRIQVLDSAGVPLAGASVAIKKTKLAGVTNEEGFFNLNVREGDVLLVSFIGMEPESVIITQDMINEGVLTVRLELNTTKLDEVEVLVNTGYQQLPKERATGSFVHIDNKMLNRTTGTDILTRLEGIVPGLLFDRTGASGEANETYELSSRGRATIMADSRPLIVLDNFPYEGRIEDINPNDVESITILRDASAASIWGAKAGNGVIVITSKVGKFEQKPTVSLRHNTRIIEKPDLFYDPNFLNAPTVMGIEEARFEKGWYNSITENTALISTPYAELLVERRDGLISIEDFEDRRNKMLITDVRHDMEKYFYQKGVNHESSVNVSGGSKTNRYYLALGYNTGRATIKRNNNTGYFLNFQNAYRPMERMELDIRLGYTERSSKNNGINITEIGGLRSGIVPYTRLVNEDGTPATVANYYRETILENNTVPNSVPWHYKPLEELYLRDQQARNNQLSIASNLTYRFSKMLSASVQYTLMKSNESSNEYFAKETYYVRNLVNSFTQANGSRIIPYEGILRGDSPREGLQHSGRFQLNGGYSSGLHEIAALAGTEVQQFTTEYSAGTLLYNYNKELGAAGNVRLDYSKSHPKFGLGNQVIPSARIADINFYLNRYLSYYGNFSYTYNRKFIISGSMRWDASNLFGVKTNQKGVPLWSLGGSWDIGKESFFDVDLIHALKLRMTYGRSGNIDKTATSQPVFGLRSGGNNVAYVDYFADLVSPGNPDLKWETVNTLNTALDFSLLKNRISGYIEYFVKDAKDLIGDKIIPPSSGLNSQSSFSSIYAQAYRFNYASMRTHGLDFSLQTLNTKGSFVWQTNVMLSIARNKVTEYFNSPAIGNFEFIYGRAFAVGAPIDMLYAYPWHGLNPENGTVVVYDEDGELTTNYTKVIQSFSFDDIVKSGVTTAPVYGSVLNTFTWKGVSMSALIGWKAGYVYRRSSIYPGKEYGVSYSSTIYFHADLYKKWQQPGDEKYTHVPKGGDINGYNELESSYYTYSHALISRGDHVFLQNININYDLPPSLFKKAGIDRVNLYFVANNLGIIWRADKHAINPITPNARYPLAKQYSLGLNVKF